MECKNVRTFAEMGKLICLVRGKNNNTDFFLAPFSFFLIFLCIWLLLHTKVSININELKKKTMYSYLSDADYSKLSCRMKELFLASEFSKYYSTDTCMIQISACSLLALYNRDLLLYHNSLVFFYTVISCLHTWASFSCITQQFLIWLLSVTIEREFCTDLCLSCINNKLLKMHLKFKGITLRFPQGLYNQ